MVDITHLVTAIIGVVSGVLIATVIPYVMGKIPVGQRQTALFLIGIAVKAAEQLFKGSGRGAEKKAWVLQWLSKLGVTLDTDLVDAMIESAVYDLAQAAESYTGIGADTTEFTPRLTRPEAGNPYYNTRAKGGYSNAIQGKPTDSGCDVLSNCVGYAYGRFNEIGGWGSCRYLTPVNAENFIQYAGGLEVGQKPRVGACIVWRKGATLSNADGAGHVAIVEKVLSDTQIVTSESGWNTATPFWTKTRNKGSDGNWGAGSDYHFLGFIYNPAPCCDGSGGSTSAETGTAVDYSGTVTSNGLNVRSGPGINNSIVSGLRKGATVQIVRESNGWGKVSTGGWVYLEYIEKSTDAEADADFEAYSGTVTASALNVRSGPGIGNTATGSLHRGATITIIQERNGWGKMTSGGWVFLEYVEKDGVG